MLMCLELVEEDRHVYLRLLVLMYLELVEEDRHVYLRLLVMINVPIISEVVVSQIAVSKADIISRIQLSRVYHVHILTVPPHRT